MLVRPAVEELVGCVGASNGCWCFASYDFPDHDPVVLSCFFVARPPSGTGTLRALLAATPNDEPVEGHSPGALRRRRHAEPVPGVLRVLLDAGFSERGRLGPGRVVRHG